MYKAFALFLLTLSATLGFGSKTTLSGSWTDSQGNPVNGYLVMRLPVPAQDTTTNTQVAPIPVYCNVINGALVSTCPQVYDVANLQPLGLYYIAAVYDNAGGKVWFANAVVTGGAFNLGAATPTAITTSNISYQSPVLAGSPNTFTAAQTFNAGATFNTFSVTTQGTFSVAGGTAPLVVTSTTPVLNLTLAQHPQLYNSSGVVLSNAKEIVGTVALSGGTATVTFGGSFTFSTSASFFCVYGNQSNANAAKIVNNSATQIGLTGTGTDVIVYDCKGT